MDSALELLDQMSPNRFDVGALAQAASRFVQLDEAEREEYLNVWDYAGLLDAEHPLTSLVPQSSNQCCVVRDLDGSLQLLWEEPATGKWSHGPLSRDDLVDDAELREALEDPEWLAESELVLGEADLLRLLAELP
jgi:hypothetical protein